MPDCFVWKAGINDYFDQAQALQYAGFSRNVNVGLVQHLVRCPEQCHWFKVYTVERPSRTLLDEIRNAWLAEYGAIPSGNSDTQVAWEKPIDAKTFMTEAERHEIDNADPTEINKLLKQVARRVEVDVKAKVEARGAQMPIKFNPKLKEQGILALK